MASIFNDTCFFRPLFSSKKNQPQVTAAPTKEKMLLKLGKSSRKLSVDKESQQQQAV